MTKQESLQIRKKATAAFASLRLAVIERSRQTGTPVVTWRDGKVCKLTPEEAECEATGTQNSNDNHSGI